MYTLLTSNFNKLNEFKRFGLSNITMKKGADVDEIDASPLLVVVYKTLEVGTNCLVEDTSLHVEGEDVGVNVRWMLDNMSSYHGRKATWEVLIGLNNGTHIEVFQGLIEGTLTKQVGSPKGFGFDNYFIPSESHQTLYELECEGKKDMHSARKQAVHSFLNGTSVYKVAIKDIPAWNGPMQKK